MMRIIVIVPPIHRVTRDPWKKFTGNEHGLTYSWKCLVVSGIDDDLLHTIGVSQSVVTDSYDDGADGSSSEDGDNDPGEEDVEEDEEDGAAGNTNTGSRASGGRSHFDNNFEDRYSHPVEDERYSSDDGGSKAQKNGGGGGGTTSTSTSTSKSPTGGGGAGQQRRRT
ncbi:unnamed protein product [Ectocarpus sp. CCAP 1310/34]|nr:unnamed protein product [Ectocarpus sp. CCAP 1310/34]